MSRLPFYFIVGLLLLVGIVASVHRHLQFEIPWFPGEQRQVWEIEAVINFNAQNGPVQVDLALPSHQAGFRVLTENTASSGYGLAYLADELGRRAQWTIREAVGSQQLYYSVQMLVSPDSRAPIQTPPGIPAVTPWESPYDTAASQLIDRAWDRSANNATFARELILDINGERQGENARLLLTQMQPSALIVRLLNQAGVQAREVSGLLLEDGRRRQTLSSWIQVFDQTAEEWTLFNPATGEQGQPENLLLWETGGRAVLEVQGGTNSRVSFSMLTRHAAKLLDSQPAAGRAGAIPDDPVDPDRCASGCIPARTCGCENVRDLYACTDCSGVYSNQPTDRFDWFPAHRGGWLNYP